MIRVLREAMSRFELVKNGGEWDRCHEPERMLPLLVQFPDSRKPRLLACAYLRYAPFDQDGHSIWDLLPGYDWFSLPGTFQNLQMAESRDLSVDVNGLNCRFAIEIAESRADGEFTDDLAWKDTRSAASRATLTAEADTFDPTEERYVGSRLREAAANLVKHCLQDDWVNDSNRLIKYLLLWPVNISLDIDEPDAIHKENGASLCHLIRDLYGNPFRRITVCPDSISEPAIQLAQTIYLERAFHLMPMLGDALEEAGIASEEVLRHCRKGGTHARGCWIIDEVLGRERLPRFDRDTVPGWLELLPEQLPRMGHSR